MSSRVLLRQDLMRQQALEQQQKETQQQQQQQLRAHTSSPIQVSLSSGCGAPAQVPVEVLKVRTPTTPDTFNNMNHYLTRVH